MRLLGLALLMLSALLLGLLIACSGSDDDDDDDNATDDEAADDDADDDDSMSQMWTDPTTGLTWATACQLVGSYDGDEGYCEKLYLDGATDWRLPTISELRTLIRGCAATETGGECGITDACRFKDPYDFDCWNESCDGCEMAAGPGTDGMYWPTELDPAAECDDAGFYGFASSSLIADVSSTYWGVDFFSAALVWVYDSAMLLCVRSAP